MKPATKRILNLVLIVGTLAIVLVIGLRDNDLPTTIKTLTQMDMGNALLCVLCFFCFLASEALSMMYFLYRRGYRITFAYAMYVTIAGQYYSCVTPGASGGQPMQIYYLHQRYVPTGVATSALVTRFFAFQFMLSVLSTLFWIAYGPFVREQIGGSMWVLIIGYIYNLFTCALVILFSFLRGPVRTVIRFLTRCGGKFHLLKNPEKTQEKWMREVDVFHESMQGIRHKPKDVLIQLLLGCVQLLSLMSILWFVYRGLDLSGATWGQVVTLDLLEYISAAYTPLPGASGAQEVVFSIYFGHLFHGASMFAGLLLWRFFTYYIFIIVGGIIVAVVGLREGKTIREVAKISEEIQEKPQMLPPPDAASKS